MSELSYDVRVEPSRVVVRVAGELDVHSSTDLRAALLEQATAGRELVLDLSGLAFLDSAGLSVLIAAHKRAAAAGGHLVLQQVPNGAARILALTGLDQLFTVRKADAV